MKVKIPKTIKIGPHTYSIKLNPHLHCDEGRYGNVNHRTQEIQIWAEALPSLKGECFIHEVIHIAELCCRIEVADPDIDRIAHVILELLTQNLGIEFDWTDITE